MRTYEEPTAREREITLNRLEHDYRAARAFLPDDWNQYANYERVLSTLDRQSSPGWPYMRVAATIGDYLYKGGLDPDPDRKAELWIHVQEVLAHRYKHTWRVFLKMEPHAPRKASQKRWRMIIQCSLAVQVAVKMATKHLQDALLETTGAHPSTYGECWFGGGWRRFRMRLERLNLVWCLDKSAWDWNSPGWIYEVVRELDKRLTCNSNSEWESFLDWAHKDAYVDSRVMMGDSIYQQLEPGLMKSGSYWTIDHNSKAQVVLDRAVCVRLSRPFGPIFATGDDTTQRKQDDLYISTLQKFGCIVKEVVEDYEFMGNKFTPDGPVPMYGAKHMKNIERVSDPELPGVIDSYMRVYVASDQYFAFFKRLAHQLGIKTKSRDYYRWFMNSPDAMERGHFAARTYHNMPHMQGATGAIV